MSNRKLIIAHRGDRSRAHENTLRAFGLAITSGADMAELDVRRTGDGELLVYHDEAFGGLILAKSDHREVVKCAAAQGIHIPRFVEVLELTSGRISLDIELKEAGYEQRVINMAFDHRFCVQDFIVTSFDIDAVRNVKEQSPGIQTGLLVENMSAESAIELFREVRPDYLAPDDLLLDKETLADAAGLGIQIIAWTVNDEGRIRDLLGSQAVAGVVTDHPITALGIRSEVERK